MDGGAGMHGGASPQKFRRTPNTAGLLLREVVIVLSARHIALATNAAKSSTKCGMDARKSERAQGTVSFTREP